MLRAMSTNLPEGAGLADAGTEASAAQAAGAGLSRMQRLQQLAAGKVSKKRAAPCGAGGRPRARASRSARTRWPR